MLKITWTNGTVGEKSPRKIPPSPSPPPSLLHDQIENKRESAYAKISERELISRIGTNHFS